MIFYKPLTFLFIAGLFIQTAPTIPPFPTPPAAPTVKRAADLSPELKQNSLNLLSAVARDTARLKLAENRVYVRIIVADLMWEHDEREARLIYQKAFVELQNLLEQVSAAGARYERMNRDEKSAHQVRRSRLAELRRDYLTTLAAHDAAEAIAARDRLGAKQVAGYDPLRQPELGLQIGWTIAPQDGKRAYRLFKEHLAAKGPTLQFIDAFKGLHERNSQVTARIARDIFVLIKNAKIHQLPPSAGDESNSNYPERVDLGEVDYWQVSVFINAASAMNRRAAREVEKKTLPALSEAELKELVEAIAAAYLNDPNPSRYSISQAMTEITLYAPELAVRIRQKAGAEVAVGFDRVMESDTYYRLLEEKNSEILAREAERTTEPVNRDLLYADAAENALDASDPEKARIIAAHIKTPKNHSPLFERLAVELPLAKARRGETAEVRRLLAGLKTKAERTVLLTELAATHSAKGERDAAKKLLDEALRILTPSAAFKNQADLEALAKIAAVYATVAPEQAFTIVENVTGEINRHIAAGVRLGAFYNSGSIEAGELLHEAMYRQLLLYVPNAADLTEKLARADFGRTTRLTDRFTRPEIRLIARLRLAQALLDPAAAEKDRKMRERFLAEQEED